MKLYRDMTAEERAQADQDHEDYLYWLKRDAEENMHYHDNLDPQDRRRAAEAEILDFWY